MLLFCAIDILNGRSVRLLHGDYNKVTDYGCPIERAKKWEADGAEFLHIVDLNGAKAGKGVNTDIIKEIVDTVKIPVQLGGGIRTMDDIENRLNSTGVDRVILGSACCENPEIISKAIARFGADKIVAGIDSVDGVVKTSGWTVSSNYTAVELGLKLKEMGLKFVVLTDITRDGALTGVNVEFSSEFSVKTGLSVVASGGVASLDDIKNLKQKNLYGAILGKAIFENRFTIGQARSL